MWRASCQWTEPEPLRQCPKSGPTCPSRMPSTGSSAPSSHARSRPPVATSPRPPGGSRPIAPTSIAACAGSVSSLRATRRDEPIASTRMSVMRVPFVLLVLGAVAPGVAAAQDTAIVIQPESGGVVVRPPELPRAVAEDAVRRYNAPTTTRLVGRSRLPRGNAWRGDVAVRNGAILVAGRIEGTLLVINGDAILDSSAVVTGDVIVIGGTAARSPAASVGGEVHLYPEPLAYRTKGEDIALAPPDLRPWFKSLGIEKSWGTADTRSSLTLATGGTFNRVEGLPIVFGPVFDWKVHTNVRLRVDALGVFRSAGNFTDKRSDLGYLFRTELRSGETPAYGLEFRAFDDV